MRIIPDVVTVTVPVEPLIAKKRKIALEVSHRAEGKNLITFPSNIEISYLVPMSAYNDEYPVKAYVDFRDARPNTRKLPVGLSTLPDVYHNVSFTPDSVEYIIESVK